MFSLNHLIGTLRQFLQPAEFRVPAPVWPAEWEASLRQLASPSDTAPTQADVSLVKQQRQEHERQKLLAEMATSLWRLRTRMLEPGSTAPKEAFRREYRHVESLWDALAAAGVKVEDPTGIGFDEGMSLKVLAYQPTPGVSRQRVHETHKPSIFLHGQLIQMGEVYVATPEKSPVPQPATPEPPHAVEPAPVPEPPAAESTAPDAIAAPSSQTIT